MQLFIAGIIFGVVVFPLLVSVEELLTLYIETVKGNLNIKVVESNVECQKINSEIEDKGSAQVIGFSVPSEEEYEEDEDD